jgi:hypothetical protein
MGNFGSIIMTRLKVWYSANRAVLEEHGFDLELVVSEEKQSLQAFRSDVGFTFIEWGNKFADYIIEYGNFDPAELGRQDDVEDLYAYFQGVFDRFLAKFL